MPRINADFLASIAANQNTDVKLIKGIFLCPTALCMQLWPNVERRMYHQYCRSVPAFANWKRWAVARERFMFYNCLRLANAIARKSTANPHLFASPPAFFIWWFIEASLIKINRNSASIDTEKNWMVLGRMVGKMRLGTSSDQCEVRWHRRGLVLKWEL